MCVLGGCFFVDVVLFLFLGGSSQIKSSQGASLCVCVWCICVYVCVLGGWLFFVVVFFFVFFFLGGGVAK